MSELLPPSACALEATCVAVLDIMGFSDALRYAHDPRAYYHRYRDALNDKLVQDQAAVNRVEYFTFSDTILVGVRGNATLGQQIADVSTFCKFLWTRCLHEGFPIRGAIAAGPVLREGNLWVGMPIVEAVEKEKEQDWIGIMLCPSATREFTPERLGNLGKDRTFARHKIPTKNGGFLEGVVLRPDLEALPTKSGATARERLHQLVAMLEHQELISGEPSVQRKYRCTIDFLTSVPSEGSAPGRTTNEK